MQTVAESVPVLYLLPCTEPEQQRSAQGLAFLCSDNRMQRALQNPIVLFLKGEFVSVAMTVGEYSLIHLRPVTSVSLSQVEGV